MREDVWNNSKFSQIPQDICSEDYISSLQKLEPRIEEFIRDHNGNHVIQKCIEAMEPEDKQVILNRYDKKVSTDISFIPRKSGRDDIIRFLNIIRPTLANSEDM